MKILLAASEVAPLIKLGGLGDVMGSLPKALEKIDVNADVIIPFYPTIDRSKYPLMKAMELEVPFDGKNHTVPIFRTKLPDSNVDVLLPEYAHYFNVGGESAFLNNVSETEMFSFFSRVVVEYVKASFNTYDVIHCHDWHTGMITHLLQEELHNERPKTLFTIHNIFYQGKGLPKLIKELGISPGSHPLIDWDIQDGDINLLLQGITSSDYIGTVSKSYANEILTTEFGGDFADIVSSRKDRLTGILNGIDYSFFPLDFNVRNWKEAKLSKKNELQKRFDLEVTDRPLFAFISRLDPGQKGLDILYEAIPSIVEKGGQFVLLGTGDPKWEEKFRQLTTKGSISCNIVFDVDLALDIYVASDFLLIPSKYEPCGLTQMIAMRYGSLPVARAVGGLKDTVKPGHNGFLFEKYDSKDLINAITLGINLFGSDQHEMMVQHAMNEDFSWRVSAQKYKILYRKMIDE